MPLTSPNIALAGTNSEIHFYYREPANAAAALGPAHPRIRSYHIHWSRTLWCHCLSNFDNRLKDVTVVPLGFEIRRPAFGPIVMLERVGVTVLAPPFLRRRFAIGSLGEQKPCRATVISTTYISTKYYIHQCQAETLA